MEERIVHKETMRLGVLTSAASPVVRIKTMSIIRRLMRAAEVLGILKVIAILEILLSV